MCMAIVPRCWKNTVFVVKLSAVLKWRITFLVERVKAELTNFHLWMMVFGVLSASPTLWWGAFQRRPTEDHYFRVCWRKPTWELSSGTHRVCDGSVKQDTGGVKQNIENGIWKAIVGKQQVIFWHWDREKPFNCFMRSEFTEWARFMHNKFFVRFCYSYSQLWQLVLITYIMIIICNFLWIYSIRIILIHVSSYIT